jgi:hypothetical protein
VAGVGNVPVAVAVVQKPDLVVSFEGGGPGLPAGFTVKNVGNTDSKLSVLKVTATLVEPEVSSPPSGSGSCPPWMTPAQCDALLGFASFLGGQGGGASASQVEKMRAACGNPFPEFLEAVPVLKPGESKTFTRNVGPHQVQISIPGLFSQAAGPQVTRVKKCSPTLICAWSVKAVADASNDNDERNEANNTATKQALREVSFQ